MRAVILWKVGVDSLVLGVLLKVIHTQTNVQLNTTGLFKYVLHFSGHQVLMGKGYFSLSSNTKQTLYIVSAFDWHFSYVFR